MHTHNTCTRMHAHTYSVTHTHVHAHTHTHSDTHTHAHTQSHTHMYTHTHTVTHRHSDTHTHRVTRTHTHTRARAHTHTLSLSYTPSLPYRQQTIRLTKPTERALITKLKDAHSWKWFALQPKCCPSVPPKRLTLQVAELSAMHSDSRYLHVSSDPVQLLHRVQCHLK